MVFIFCITDSFILSCGNKSNDPSYLTVVLPCKQDTTGIYKRMLQMEELGIEYQFVKQDTSYIRNLISKPIIQQVNGSTFVKSTEDLSNADSAIIVIELESGVNKIEAKYDIKDKLEEGEKNLPTNLPHKSFILTRHIRNNKNQGITWERGDAYDEFQDILRKDPNYIFRNVGKIF